MRLPWRQKPKLRWDEWHERFAWLPIAVSDTRLLWGRFYYCRREEIAPGNYAGGHVWRWIRIDPDTGVHWKGPELHD